MKKNTAMKLTPEEKELLARIEKMQRRLDVERKARAVARAERNRRNNRSEIYWG